MEHYEGEPRIRREGDGLYYIIGMDYGYLWTTLGSRWSFQTYSGAYRKLRQIRSK
jgi:hypothetical protein